MDLNPVYWQGLCTKAVTMPQSKAHARQTGCCAEPDLWWRSTLSRLTVNANLMVGSWITIDSTMTQTWSPRPAAMVQEASHLQFNSQVQVEFKIARDSRPAHDWQSLRDDSKSVLSVHAGIQAWSSKRTCCNAEAPGVIGFKFWFWRGSWILKRLRHAHHTRSWTTLRGHCDDVFFHLLLQCADVGLYLDSICSFVSWFWDSRGPSFTASLSGLTLLISMGWHWFCLL